MMTAILPAVVTGIVTLVVCLINNHYQRIEADKKHDETMTLITYRLDELTAQVSKHNEVIERTYKLEQAQAVTDAKMASVDRRLVDLEKKGA